MIVAENHKTTGGLATLVVETLYDAGVVNPLIKIGLADSFFECGFRNISKASMVWICRASCARCRGSLMELEGRVALITGAASGLGLATAKALAREGARIIINDLDRSRAEAAAESLGDRHSAVVGDVSSEDQVNAIVAESMDRHGKIDILVNNAGVPDGFTPTVDQALSHWQRLIDIHLTGTYLVSKTVAPSMIARRSGVILNLNSIAGVLGLPVRTAYSAAKAGIGHADARARLRVGAAWRPGQRGGARIYS